MGESRRGNGARSTGSARGLKGPAPGVSCPPRRAPVTREQTRAITWGLVAAGLLGVAIFVGSRNLRHIDAALVGYTFACLFAAFGLGYRYSMWLQRPPTWRYWWRGWQSFLRP